MADARTRFDGYAENEPAEAGRQRRMSMGRSGFKPSNFAQSGLAPAFAARRPIATPTIYTLNLPHIVRRSRKMETRFT
jgi:hypothetical protein